MPRLSARNLISRKIGLLMQPVVETLSGLERRVDLAVSVADVEKEVQAQLKRVARTAKVPGFRPGKAPLAMLERSHGPSIRYDVINSQVGRARHRRHAGVHRHVRGLPRSRRAGPVVPGRHPF
ncbi:hypothetical protein G6F50_016689 [Rhizopus delemar]|uniref:Trigger factor ribosome-binding bacterial domain-containing protein n=1 Tax=Rhizopus delemar TaxID=936053 RepID=A0A9P6XSS0_9FUNG|nr:hypothetical protein G6F50_016689 [Rhizopus delemar]